MARHWRMVPVLGFSNCSWAECDVDRGRPMATRNVLERANLLLEGYFLSLYVHLGGSKTRMEITSSKSMKFYVSMFSDKSPCMPLYFGTAVIILLEAIGAFSSFLASAATFSFFSLYSNGFFFSFFFLLSLLLPLLFLPLPLIFLRLFLLS